MITSGTVTATLISLPQLRTFRWRRAKVAAFVALGFSAFIPLLHGKQLYGLEYMLQYSGMSWYLVELVTYGAGTIFYGVSLHARYFSHQFLRELVCSG